MKSKNITLKIDEETYRKARVRAARQGTSVSAMVRETLARYAEPGEVSDTEEAQRRMTLDDLWKRIHGLPRPVIAGRKFTREHTYDHRRFHRY